MARLFAQARFIIGALVFVLALAVALPASAQRNSDGSVNPTASSVKEQQLLGTLQRGGSINGRVSIPDQKSANLIHHAHSAHLSRRAPIRLGPWSTEPLRRSRSCPAA